MRTDDPGTPGNRNLEVNFASTLESGRTERLIEAPLFDMNYGLGNQLQLKLEVPVVHQTEAQFSQAVIGDLLAGVKWRFHGDSNHSLQISTYPQLEFDNSGSPEYHEQAGHGLHFLLPIEIAKKLGPVSANAEAGYWFTQDGTNQWILGLAISHNFDDHLELIGEIYALGKTTQTQAPSATLDLGARRKLRPPLILLLMGGHSVGYAPAGTPQWVAYAGLQVLFHVGKRHSGT
jgi:hypothetical protein